ncbi:MAG: hypothetical protein ACFE0I_07810 [Elainellaceae cyanobacterium]
MTATTTALLGLVFLGEHLILRAIAGIALVMLAAAGHSRYQGGGNREQC